MNARTRLPRPRLRGALTIASIALSIPLASPWAGDATEEEMLRQAEVDRVQGEIDAELRRQEILQRNRDLTEIGRALNGSPAAGDDLDRRANPRIAPTAPVDRDLPVAIFDSETIEVPPGTLDNVEPMVIIVRRLDADRDGNPEQIRYINKETGEMFRKEADRDYDGALDSWQTYTAGSLTERTLDTNGDGNVDTWEKYQGGRMIERIIDRDGNGVQDAFYTFTNGALVEERHDRNNDGEFDRVVTYQGGNKTRSREDSSGDGKIDTWTIYAVVAGAEMPVAIKRDSNGTGKIDVVETFETSSGKPIILKREEDTNGDGKFDVTSTYRNGKLHRREFADPTLATE